MKKTSLLTLITLITLICTSNLHAAADPEAHDKIIKQDESGGVVALVQNCLNFTLEQTNEQGRIYLQARIAIQKNDFNAFTKILDTSPDIVNFSKPESNGHNLLLDAIQNDLIDDRTLFIQKLLHDGAQLNTKALQHHLCHTLQSICRLYYTGGPSPLIVALKRFYNTIATAKLPEELNFKHPILGDITTPQQFVQACSLEFLNLNIWHCNFCKEPWTKHPKYDPDSLQCLREAVELKEI